jgi:hypothetical protein
MFFWRTDGDGGELLLALTVGILIGALCGGIPLTVGLLKGNKSMAWTGFGVSILLGIACTPIPVALLPAIVFTIIVAVTEPIGKKKRKVKRRRRATADDLLDDDFGPRRRRDDDDEERRRRRRRYEDDDYDDRPRRRRRDDDD